MDHVRRMDLKTLKRKKKNAYTYEIVHLYISGSENFKTTKMNDPNVLN
jgi:hypothetical protein